MSYYNDRPDSYERDSYSPPRHGQHHDQHGGPPQHFQPPPGPPPGRFDEQDEGGRRYDGETHYSSGSGGGGYEDGRQHYGGGGGGRFQPPPGPPPSRYGGEERYGGREEGEGYGRQHGGGGRQQQDYGGEEQGYSGSGYNARYQQQRSEERYEEEERPSHGYGSGGRQQQQEGRYSSNDYNASEESPYPSSQKQQQQHHSSASSYNANAEPSSSPYPAPSSGGGGGYSSSSVSQGYERKQHSTTTSSNNSPYPSYTGQPPSTTTSSSSPYPTSSQSQQSYNSNTSSQTDSPYPPYNPSASTGGKPAAYADFPVHQNAAEGTEGVYSDMRGRRKALFIGINYTNSSHALQGCHNDVANLSRWVGSQGYKQEGMRFLMDDGRSEEPSRGNMIEAMKWLVEGAKPNDVLFFHYSGHGSQQATDQRDEADGMAETICPVDYESEGMITDDELHQILVTTLPKGCRLTAIFDCCHSGSSLDCPYMYSTSGKLKGPDYTSDLKSGALSAFKAYTSRDLGGLFSSLAVTGKKVFDEQQAGEVSKRERGSEADVISWSGCKDNQTSADASEGGQATGAMSHAFVAALTKAPKQTYNQLLNTIRDELKGKYEQKPQLSCSHELDCDLLAVF
ncbi:caspase domain-domain-containing protein [Leucosporidium creatinivorum]|uniref:Caspase domain-domain-containing protein n=1 Tax=Leucosporidium creatinivorum TaxID=106004 RepID=A0A1Y2EZI9_9BASI|nr:caspase domain-domain-containing protein [Leucosporidium creatinivorum]